VPPTERRRIVVEASRSRHIQSHWQEKVTTPKSKQAFAVGSSVFFLPTLLH